MKKFFIWLLTLISSFIFIWIDSVFWYWEFFPAPINISFYEKDWSTPLSNYEVRLRTWKWTFYWYTNWDWVLNLTIDLPLSRDKEWEYSMAIDLWFSRFILYNEKIHNWIKVFFDKEEWFIKSIHWIESKKWNYAIIHWEKWLKTWPFPAWAWFWVTWFIMIMMFFTTYNLIMWNDQKFLRIRNSMFWWQN